MTTKNDENNKIVFFVVSTKENSKMANYSINDWDSFNFPIISLKDLDKEKIINNIETKLKDNIEFTDRELLELGLTPILENSRESIINQFYDTAELMAEISFPNDEIKYSVYGLVLMLSSMYFEELDPIRKRIQGDLMGKVDCVREACQESYDNGFSEGKSEGRSEGFSEGRSEGFSEGLEDVAKRMLLNGDYSFDEISEVTGLSLGDVVKLKRSL